MNTSIQSNSGGITTNAYTPISPGAVTLSSSSPSICTVATIRRRRSHWHWRWGGTDSNVSSIQCALTVRYSRWVAEHHRSHVKAGLTRNQSRSCRSASNACLCNTVICVKTTKQTHITTMTRPTPPHPKQTQPIDNMEDTGVHRSPDW